MARYDVVGDIHGHGDKLRALLDHLGWVEGAGGRRRHVDADRQVVFVGDLIDRGPAQLDVLTTVRSMVDDGTALIVMGNHELNAIGYATEDPDRPGRYLREHSEKNRRQHEAFLTQLDEGQQAEWVAWFASLPLWLDLGGLRVVHACWHQPSIDRLEAALGGNRFARRLDDLDAIVGAHRRGGPTMQAIEVLLKGPEVVLDDYGLPAYADKGGDRRDAARVRWWDGEATTIAELADIPHGTTRHDDGTPYPPVEAIPWRGRSFAYTDPVPVVYGHHWRRWEPTERQDWTRRTACVDFSAGKGGPLAAYRWQGESEIDPGHYVSVP